METIKQSLYKLKVLWDSINYVPDYTVKKVYMGYCSDACIDMSQIHEAWNDEAKYWDSIDAWYHWDLTREYKKLGMDRIREIMEYAPDEVNTMVLTVKYTYGTRTYKFVTTTHDFDWPPLNTMNSSLRFRFPISEVWALDSNDRPVVDITSTIKKISGPRGDFHGQDVPFKYIMKYDYPKIEVKTLMDSRIYKDDESVLLI